MNLVLVEDNPGLSEAFARMVAELPAHRLVGAFPSAEAALEVLRPGMADLLVVDLDLPGQTGVELIARVREEPLGLSSLVWTIFDGHAAVYSALKAGALGYLLKATGVEELEDALRLFEQGGVPMTPRIARRLLRDMVQAEPLAEPEPDHGLSLRERSVLRAIAAGHSHKEVAQQMGISQHTVHTHLKRIYRKLHAAGRDQALERARRLGIVVQD